MAPMTNAERQKRYRERLKQNPAKYEELRLKHLDRVKKSKNNGIKCQNEQQKEITREKWRRYSARYYAKNNKKANREKGSDEDIQATNVDIENCENKKWRSRNARLKKELRLCREKLHHSFKRHETMRKQIYRLKQQILKIKQDGLTEENISSPTPSDFDVLSESLGLVYKESTRKEKQVLKKVMKSSITSKHRMTAKITKAVGIKGKIRSNCGKSAKRKLLICEIHNFYLRDDISQATAGKKECKTKNKTKMQIRLLTDTIYNLYKIYKRDGGKASYSTLSRHRPFYVIPPKLQNRDTCACIRHSNIKFKILKLYKLGLIKTKQTEELLIQIACSLKSKECMYGQCKSCATKKIEILGLSDDTEISWLEWRVKKIPYRKKTQEGKEIEVLTQKCLKEVVTDKLSAFKIKFHEEITLFKKHIFNMTHQQKSFRQCVDEVKENEAVIIVDFSENYQCKYNQEVQSMHFGSSRRQITLHTGVAYFYNEKPEAFSSISPNNEHSPLSIWAHLQPVLNNIKYQHPEIDTLHVFSDGPTTQYRQKLNFALFDRLTKQIGFQNSTWSYFEASHGKNSADGVGGALKRTLDMCVAYGTDISTATMAFKVLKQKTTITLFYIDEKDIQQIKNNNNFANLCPLVGTLSVHQIITTTETGKIRYRQISCFCGEKRGSCSCFDIKEHNLLKKDKTTKNTMKTSVAVKSNILNRQINKELDPLTAKAGPSYTLKNNDAFIKNTNNGKNKSELESVLVMSKTDKQKTVAVKSKGLKRQSTNDTDAITIKAGPSKILKKNTSTKNKITPKNNKESEPVPVSSKCNEQDTVAIKSKVLKRKCDEDSDTVTVKAIQSVPKKNKNKLNLASVKSKTSKKQSVKKTKAKSSKTSFFDTSSSETEHEINYAESGDSPIITNESNSDLETQSNVKQNYNKKVTILSNVKLSANNRRYFNFNNPGPSALHLIDTNYDLYNANSNADVSCDEEEYNIFDM